MNATRRALDWFFRNRRTGAITIGQFPNAPLLIFSACAAIDWIAAPGGSLGAVIRILGALALTYWAIDELLRGVNPWRRCLGATVLAGVAWNVVRALS
ncbi:hypothetical protein [Methylobacterium sp. J-068]|uniref:hypothetical protein n=1 Tax=Methylobacterium sp. J-068 TaxID=2836649 RepID=UPI001FBB8A3B|nr:hypothetical protein [Methylobacterium sp. J-068]MCJ2037103.1 hypothetical protein [Methylobacterium sp. J-068]